MLTKVERGFCRSRRQQLSQTRPISADDAVSRNGELEKKIRDNKIFISIVFETRIGRRVATKTSTAEPNKNGKFA
jgi:hypothetical protein